MTTILPVVVFVLSFEYLVNGFPDLIPEAITVYRNPQFFKNLNYGIQVDYNRKPGKTSEAQHKPYKYPSEVHKSGPPPSSPGFEINYDNSPEFQHEPRDIFVNTAHKPTRKKGPYSPKHSEGNTLEHHNKTASIPIQKTKNEGGNNNNRKSKENDENESVEKPRDFASVFKENSDEEFRAYQEPVLLARPNFDPAESSGARSSTYGRPYPYNRTSPVLYEDWKFYTYPKIHANEHLKPESKIYSEEPPSNYFEDEPSLSYYRYDDETEDPYSVYENENLKNLGADTKHIYKKLLKPKKSFLFKINSKPKFKKIKFHLKKKHPLKTDWFDEYPFDF